MCERIEDGLAEHLRWVGGNYDSLGTLDDLDARRLGRHDPKDVLHEGGKWAGEFFSGRDRARAWPDAHATDDLHRSARNVTTWVLREQQGCRVLEEALRQGVFCELGKGDSGIDSVIEALRTHGYAGWLVIEQDQYLRASDTPESVVAVQRANREYLRRFGI